MSYDLVTRNGNALAFDGTDFQTLRHNVLQFVSRFDEVMECAAVPVYNLRAARRAHESRSPNVSNQFRGLL